MPDGPIDGVHCSSGAVTPGPLVPCPIGLPLPYSRPWVMSGQP
jgi:hypothetical protein